MSNDVITPYPLPAVGQAWADNDPRQVGREIVIMKTIEINGRQYAICMSRSKHLIKIRLDRFKPHKNGYRYLRG